MKPKHLSLFFAMSGLGSLVLLSMLLSYRSIERYGVFTTWSGPLLIIPSLILSMALAFVSFRLISAINPQWALRFEQLVDDWLRRPDNLLAIIFYNSLFVLVIPATLLAGIYLQHGHAISRVVELIILFELLLVLSLGFVLIRYHTVYRQPGFFADAPRKIVRFSFIGRLAFWLSAGLLLIAALVLFRSSNISMGRNPSHDSGIFLYFGQQILRGQIPFRDLWDHKPPMIFYMDALGLFFGQGSIWGVWFFEYLSLAISSLLGFWTLRHYYRIFPAIFGVCLSLGVVVLTMEGGNLTEEFSLPLQWIALALFAISYRRGFTGYQGALRAFASGVLFSMALNFKQTMVGIWVAQYLWLALVLFCQRKWALWKVFAWAAFGAVLTQAVFVLYYASKGTLTEYWQVAFVYNLVYSDITISDRVNALSLLWVDVSQTIPVFLLAGLAWIWGMAVTVRAVLRRDQDMLSFPLLIGLIDFPIELVLISVSGMYYLHYFITLIPGVTVLLAWLAFQAMNLSQRLALSNKILSRLIPIGVLLLAGILIKPSADMLLRKIKPSTERTITDTAAMIRKETQPDDYVLMWGSQAVVNYLSGRPSPTRFVHQKALFREGFATPSLSFEMLNDLQTRKPKLIINTHLNTTPFITKEPDGSCRLPPEPPDGMEAVFQFICQNYYLEKVITKDNWEVYRKMK